MGITFKEIGDDCSLCPLRKEDLCQGLVNYGNGPVYPPCSEMDENTDVKAYLEKRHTRERKMEEQRKERQKAESETKRKKELQKKRRAFTDMYCKEEIKRVNNLKKAAKAFTKVIEERKIDISLSEALAEIGVPMGNQEKMNGDVQKLEKECARIETLLESAKQQLVSKRLEAQRTEEYKNIS